MFDLFSRPSLKSKISREKCGPLIIFGAQGNMGKAFLQVVSDEMQTCAWQKVTVVVSTLQAREMQPLVDDYADDDLIEFWTVDYDDEQQIKQLIQGQKQVVFLPNSYSDRMIKFQKESKYLTQDQQVMLVTSQTCDQAKSKFFQDYRAMQNMLPGQCQVECEPFMEFLFAFAPDIQAGLLPLPIIDKKFAPVAVDDVAKYCVHILLQPWLPQMYKVSGPNMVGGKEIALIASNVLQRQVKFDPSVTEAQVRQLLQSRRVSEYLIDGMLEYFSMIKEGQLEWQSDLNEVLMCESVGIEEFFARNSERFLQASTSQGTSEGTSEDTNEDVPVQYTPILTTQAAPIHTT